MTTGPRIDHYHWSGGREAMLRFGPADAPTVIVAPPLFEEANRTRRLLIAVLRGLAERGIGGAFPDLPGQGESVLPTDAVDFDAVRAGFAAAVGRIGGQPFALSVRSGSLIEDGADVRGRWRLTPMMAGGHLVRELARMLQIAGGGRLPPNLTILAEPVRIAGSLIGPAMLRQLDTAKLHAPARLVRLADDLHLADHRIPGAPLWRHAEPAAAPRLIEDIVDDVARWVASCAG